MSLSQRNGLTFSARRRAITRRALTLCFVGILARTASAQWVQCSNQATGVTNCTGSGVSVGIGTATPGGRLHIYAAPTADIFAGMGTDMSAGPSFNFGYGGATFGRGAGFFNVRPDVSAVAPNPSVRFMTTNVERMIITNTGSIGIGTSAPVAPALLHVNGILRADEHFESRIGGSNTIGSGSGLFLGDAAGTYNAIQEVANKDMTFWTTTTAGVWAERLRITSNGNVGVGTTSPNPAYVLDVAGNANFSGTVTGGNIVAKYQDVAEWVPAVGDLTPGTVVSVKADGINEVVASTRAYDSGVAGVVSAKPGITLGEAGTHKAQIATTGRVKVRVDATHAPIHAGDVLVTSDIPGTAMKSEPIDAGGVKIHRPGTIIGKALEPLEAGQAEILTLLSLQ